MGKSSFTLRIIGFLAVSGALTMPLHAPPSLVLVTPPNYGGLYNIQEGGLLNLTYQFTNDTSAPVSVNWLGVAWNFVSGDTSDMISDAFILTNSCFVPSIAPNGGSCAFTILMSSWGLPWWGPLLDSKWSVNGDIDIYTETLISEIGRAHVSDIPETPEQIGR